MSVHTHPPRRETLLNLLSLLARVPLPSPGLNRTAQSHPSWEISCGPGPDTYEFSYPSFVEKTPTTALKNLENYNCLVINLPHYHNDRPSEIKQLLEYTLRQLCGQQGTPSLDGLRKPPTFAVASTRDGLPDSASRSCRRTLSHAQNKNSPPLGRAICISSRTAAKRTFCAAQVLVRAIPRRAERASPARAHRA